ncbi:hypothetical protein Hypma_003023 [Hypsizygus marmoreus]|uniref:Uncharacterized protein n=1 Tax=Hypsizygus marmoreus TaxID=39966 RepID=A0A369JBL8_HYPMA|nr:hypothetical protein Hypma_003023 [Hypsizygus marmoreus]
MHTYYSKMPEYKFDLPSYTFSGLTLPELPKEAQKLIEYYGFSVEHYDTQLIDEVRLRRADRLGRTLTGIFRELVAQRREVVGLQSYVQTNGHQWDQYTEEEVAEIFDAIARHLFENLLPELREHLEAFIEETDGLVWLEEQVRKGTEEELTAKELAAHRKLLLDPIIESLLAELASLDRDAVLSDLERLAERKEDARKAALQNHGALVSATA